MLKNKNGLKVNKIKFFNEPWIRANQMINKLSDAGCDMMDECICNAENKKNIVKKHVKPILFMACIFIILVFVNQSAFAATTYTHNYPYYYDWNGPQGNYTNSYSVINPFTGTYTTTYYDTVYGPYGPGYGSAYGPGYGSGYAPGYGPGSSSYGQVSGWIQTGNNEYMYYYGNGTYARDGFYEIEDSWYYFESNGRMHKGWLYLNGYWYYMLPSGKMAVSGWNNINERWYYFNDAGIMQTGYIILGSSIYYADASGARVQSGYNPDGHLFDANGVMIS